MLDWAEDLTLIGVTQYVADEYGNQIPTSSERVVQASKKEISSSEFYAAAQSGIKPEVEMIIHTFEYEGELNAEYNGTQYSVIRTYQRNADEIELYLQRKVSDIGKGN